MGSSRHLKLVGADGSDDRHIPAPPGPTPEEGLRLIEAFRQINDPSRRMDLIRAAERCAGQ